METSLNKSLIFGATLSLLINSAYVLAEGALAPVVVIAGEDFGAEELGTLSLTGSIQEGTGLLPYSIAWVVTLETCIEYKAARDRPGYNACVDLRTALEQNSSNIDTLTPSYIAPALPDNIESVPIEFRLTATRSDQTTSTDTVRVTIVKEPPATTSDAPTNLTATPGDGQVSVAFTAPASDGGAAITDYEYQLDGGSWVSASTTTSPVVINGLTNGTSYSIILRAVNSAGNGAESVAVTTTTPSPASAFEERKDDMQQIIVDDALRVLNSTIASNRQMSTEARNRLLENRRQGAQGDTGIASRNNVPFDVNGFAEASGGAFVTKGTFFGQAGNFEGTQRRLVFGDFDIQRDEDTGSSTATLTGRIAWEQMISDETLLGYFVGGELAKSTIDGTFEGEQTRVGATAGGYMVHAFTDGLIADGSVSLGVGRNNLDIADDVLAVEGDYTSRTATIGGAFTGIYAFERFELRPEIAASYGKTWLGDIGMTGTAYGLTDNTVTLDAGTVSQTNLTLRPEFIYGLDADTVADSRAQISFAPRLICERTISSTTTEDCGAGAEIGLTGSSEDGLTSANFRIVMDRVGNSDRSSFGLSLQHLF